jgi:hypothetical protein
VQNVEPDAEIERKGVFCNGLDTIIVTFYNAPEANTLKEHYIDLPQKLETEGTKHSRDLNPIPFWCVWRPMASLTALETAGMNNLPLQNPFHIGFEVIIQCRVDQRIRTTI